MTHQTSIPSAQRAPAPLAGLDLIWAAVALLTPLWLAFLTPIQRLDVWWHIAVGEIITAGGPIPTVDIYSFTAQGAPYGYANIWLADVIFYWLHRLGGPALLVGATGVLLCAAFGLVWRLAWQRSGSARLATAVSLISASLAIRFGAARPQIFSIFLFALFFWLLCQARQQRQARWLWPLPPLMALWTNLHGAFPLGLVLVGFILVEALLHAVRKRSLTQHRPWLSALLVCLMLTLAATGANPAGYGIFGAVQSVLNDPASQQLVLEWQPQDIKVTTDLPFFVLSAVAVLIFIYAPARPWIGDVLLWAGFWVLGIGARRNGIWLALVSPPLLAGYLAQFPLLTPKDAPTTTRPRRQGPARLLLVLFTGLTILLSPWVRPQLGNQRLGYGLLDRRTPVAAVEYMAQQGINGRVFHPQWFGDYLIWRAGPNVQVFLDGRVHLYNRQTWRDYSAILNGWEWERLLDAYQVSWVLLDTDDASQNDLRSGLRASPHWRLQYADAVALLFARVAP